MNAARIFRNFLFGGALSVLALTANAALFADDEARKAILDLRQKVDAQQQRNIEELKKASDENAQLRRSILDLSNQIEVLRADIAKLRGQDEQLAREVADMQRKQKDISQGVDERLRKFEPSKITVDGQEFVASPDEVRDYGVALAMLRKGEFAAAQTSFTDFINRYPVSGYRPSALFWLGNAQYALRAYREAIVNFKSVVALAPEHVRAPEAALSVANCQIELKDKAAARKTLTELINVYPKSEAASVAKDRLTKLK
ncbi:MAG: tol-pal system protein YbgF [Polaromonas sp.]|jgi:tol-pal system protein YbgF